MYLVDRGIGEALDLGDGDVFGRIEDIDQVVGNSAPFRERRFGHPDLEVAVEVAGVGVDDFAGEFEREIDRAGGFADAGWPEDGDQWRRRAVRHVALRVVRERRWAVDCALRSSMRRVRWIPARVAISMVPASMRSSGVRIP